jgi:DNA recombination protein RmuC
MENIEEIKRLAERLVERTGTLYNHLTSLGSSLERSTKAYNSLVGSLEGQLLVTVREIQSHGVKTARTIVDAEAVDEVARHLDERRWPSGASQFAVLDVTDAELAGELGVADPVHGAGEHAAVVE